MAPDDLGVRIRARRAQLGLTQEQAAARAGVSPTTWRNLELGRRNARPLTLAAVSDALRVDENELLGSGNHFDVVRQVADVVEEQPTADAVLVAFHALCQDLVPAAEVARVAFIVFEGGYARSLAVFGGAADAPPIGMTLHLDEDPELSRIAAGEMVILHLGTQERRVNPVRQRLHAAGMRSMMAVPLRTGGQVPGFLLLSSPRERAFAGTDLMPLVAAGRVVVHVLSSLLVFGEPGNLRGVSSDERTEAYRLVARLLALRPEDRRLVHDLVDRLGAGGEALVR